MAGGDGSRVVVGGGGGGDGSGKGGVEDGGGGGSDGGGGCCGGGNAVARPGQPCGSAWHKVFERHGRSSSVTKKKNKTQTSKLVAHDSLAGFFFLPGAHFLSPPAGAAPDLRITPV